MKRDLGVIGLVVASAACLSGAPPALQQPHTAPSSWLILAPLVRVGEGPLDQVLAEQLVEELRTQLQSRGFTAHVEDPGGAAEAGRVELLEVIARTRGGAGERLHRGTDLGLGGSLQALADAGWETAVVTRLAGHVPEPGRGIPLPPDAVMPNRDNGPDYVVPQSAHSAGNAVALEMLLVSTQSSTVIIHRRVAIPADSRDRLALSLPALVRECLRGISP